MKSPDKWVRLFIRFCCMGMVCGFGWSANVMAADGDAARGEKLAMTCLGCHGVKGYYNTYPTYRVPKLGGQSAKYIESALKAYADGSRAHDTMHANAENLSEQDMADIGAYMSQSGN
ncbi:MAG: c-type cytochrome [Gammaproteobacteria bacterium]